MFEIILGIIIAAIIIGNLDSVMVGIALLAIFVLKVVRVVSPLLVTLIVGYGMFTILN